MGGGSKPSMRKLLIDTGHSKRYPGAIGIRSEVEWNRAIWRELKPLLNPKKWQVVEVPTDYLTDWSANRQLVNRIAWINKNSAVTDVLLSIHGNAATNPKARGVTTCYMGGSESARLEAVKLSQSYAKATGTPVWNGGAFDDRNGRYGQIGMVRQTKPLALLIEAGFVTNPLDMKVEAKKAAEGIANYFNTFYGA